MLSYPYGKPLLRGEFKSSPEDFVVVEELGFEPDGQGEHCLLLVEKRGLGTLEMIDRIAAEFQLEARDIGYSGLKDKQAVTRQWISIPYTGKAVAIRNGSEYRVLEQHLHRRKLRRGSHRSNYFEVCLRRVEYFGEAARAQLKSIFQNGFANYFGEQRFGRQQDNVAQALRSLSRPRMARWRKGLLISALRSHLFNQIVARRIELGLWQEPLQGDVFMLTGSHSIFSEPVDDTIRQRFANLDIASTASLYGSGPCLLKGQARDIEEEVFSANPDITRCLDRHGAKRQMRAMRAVVRDPAIEYESTADRLRLKLRLPAGSYLTSLLDHCLLREASI